MIVRSDLSVDWAVSPRILEVAAPSVDISIQDLVDTCRTLEQDLSNIDKDNLIDAFGKNPIPGGGVGITLQLNNARVKFEDRVIPTICIVNGGNLTAIDEFLVDMWPVEYSTNVLPAISQSSSPTLAQSDEIDAIKERTDNIPSDPASESLAQDIRDIIGTPISPTIAADLDGILDEVLTKASELTGQAIKEKTDALPSDPAAQSLVEAHITEEADEMKGPNWTDETLKRIKELVEEAEKPKASFKI